MNHIRNVSISLKFRTSQLYGLAPLRLFVTLTYHIASWYLTPIEVPYQLRRSRLVSAITNDSCTQYELHHSDRKPFIEPTLNVAAPWRQHPQLLRSVLDIIQCENGLHPIDPHKIEHLPPPDRDT